MAEAGPGPTFVWSLRRPASAGHASTRQMERDAAQQGAIVLLPIDLIKAAVVVVPTAAYVMFLDLQASSQ